MFYVYDKISGDKEDQELPTVEAEIFHLIVKYMYSDTTDLTEDVAAKVMEIAHMYQIQGLVEYCATYLKSILRSDNACEILYLAMFYGTQELRDAACDFIDDNAVSVIDSDKFIDMSESCLTYILKGDTFYVDETKIVEAADRWASHRLNENLTNNIGPEKRKLLGEGFFYLRIPSMRLEEFLVSTKTKVFYTADEVYEIVEAIELQQNSASCHSLVNRVPRQETLNFELTESSLKKKCSEVKCDMLLAVLRDCEIKYLRLHQSYGFFYRESAQFEATVCFVFRGKLTIDDSFELEFDWIPLKTDEITLKVPIRLPKTFTKPYRMKLSLRLENDPNITVEVDQYPFPSQSGYRACAFTNDVLKIAYSKHSTHVNIVKSIDISTFSNRNSCYLRNPDK